ncbi:MAG: hypothetical protein LBR12_01920 [Opitutaceae bacterium]|jgi:hypothetical protein|nr:hypothetical protein [Opitutaceae bacterium]
MPTTEPPASSKPLVYAVLGAAGSDRREIVADLIAAGLEDAGQVAVLLSENETAAPADASLAGLSRVARWSWEPSAGRDRAVAAGKIRAALPEGTAVAFLITDGRANPVDQIEALKPWLAENGAELARVFCVVDCRLAEKHPPLLRWFDACVHFSDMVFLCKRGGVPNKWIADFIRRYQEQRAPALFEQVKNNRVHNPALALLPQARRISHYFDEDEWAGFEPDNDGDDDLRPETDPWLERATETRRVRDLPDLAKVTGL